jgi:glycosyltransferase 2 family protein
MNARKFVSLILGFVVSGVFLWTIFRALPFLDFLQAIQSANSKWILIGVTFFVMGYACRIWRWCLMLSHYNKALSWGRCSVPFMVSIAANNVLPFRAGDVLRGVAFSKWLGVPTARVCATLLVERLLDLLSLILAFSITLNLFSSGQSGMQTIFGWSAWTFAMVAGAIALILLFPHFFKPMVHRVLGALPSQDDGLSTKISAQADHVFQTLASLTKFTQMATLMIWSFLAWVFEACVFYSIARALPGITSPVAAWLAMPVGTLSTMLPSTPGYIGTFHYFVIQVTETLGNPEFAAAAFAFIVHLTLFIPTTLWGGICFIYWIFKRQRFSKHQTK